MAHTAREAGPAPGPDFMFGWGLIDAGKGKVIMDGVKDTLVTIQESKLIADAPFDYEFTYDGVDDLVVTMAWNDPAGTVDLSGDFDLKKLVNDLDITLTNVDTGKVFYPWSLVRNWALLPTSTGIATNKVRNQRDNIEPPEAK